MILTIGMAHQREAFVYGLVDPISRIPFYVGESTIGMRRPRVHASKGWTFDVVILEAVGNPTAPVASICPSKLSAVQVGQRRAPLSPETRARISAAKTGRVSAPFTSEHRAKLSAAAKAKHAKARMGAR